MRIVTVRRICQIFFLLLFLWFCVVTALGEKWWQLRGWPVNWIIQLDPLVGLGTMLSTRTVYAGLLWGLVTIILTIVLGRFFCGWLCPFGSIHQFIGFLGRRGKPVTEKLKANRYRRAQGFKYWLLVFLLSAALGDIIMIIIDLPAKHPLLFGLAAVAGLIGVIWFSAIKQTAGLKKGLVIFLLWLVGWVILNRLIDGGHFLAASLQTGLLDPIPLLHRSINLVLLPVLDMAALKLSPNPRLYEGAWLIGTIFMAALCLNLMIPRFYCRFICPLGAFFGILSRFAIWRIGKADSACKDCQLCEKNCEGGCEPTTQIRLNECVLCLNCIDDCRHGFMVYQTGVSKTGESVTPDLTRRELMVSFLSGALIVPVLRLDGSLGPNWYPGRIRPPGALTEDDFLSRCVKCGQCMRVCPTNVIQPAGLSGGLEGLWTPVLNFRIGTSGCQVNCIACGHVCPTAAIRPLHIDERFGKNDFSDFGPLRMGTAYVDRGRCLPWAMDRPCIVCQENCPVSPKAIFTREYFSPVRISAPLGVKTADHLSFQIGNAKFKPNAFATGDYYCRDKAQRDDRRRKIIRNTTDTVFVSDQDRWQEPLAAGTDLEILIRLQRPVVDPLHCIGCGVCEHECPVKGKRAIRVTAENESRNRGHALLL